MLEKIITLLEKNGIDINFVPHLAGDLDFLFNMESSGGTDDEVLRLKAALNRKQIELMGLRVKNQEPTLIVKQNHLNTIGEKNLENIKFHTHDEVIEWEKNTIFKTKLFEMGTRCPICTQYIKLYKRTINKSMATELIRLYNATKKYPGKIYFHVNNDLHRQANASGIDKLRHWGLVEEKDGINTDTEGKNSGFWKILPKGIAFVEGRERLAKYVKIYNRAFYGLEESETIGIFDCMETEFNYRELMNA